MSKLPSSSNGVDDPSSQRKPCSSCMQFGHIRQSHQSCPENLRNKQAFTKSIANRSDDLPSDAQSTTNVSFENKNGDAVDSKANDNGADNAAATKVINGHAEQEATGVVALPPTAKYSEVWIRWRPDFSH
ncbi:hypothetical protein MAM1_0994d11409 [Mucor ambiguus]|uniref:Uncharacterized protein n=1 Tax=Mucor ambiguus TaxID=91626 RepID=A0A0C9MM27_9FUNG|nr:hypothetical protein MAM1_0994d11409 [Mucor ambiguus]